MGYLIASPCRAAQSVASEATPTYLVDHWTTADGLPVNGVNRVLRGRSGYLWLATFDGLVRFDGHHSTVFQAGPKHPNLPDNRMLDLVQTRDGQLWMYTEAQRLVRFDGHAFYSLGPEDGLPDAPLHGIQLDRFGTLWVTTNAGLAYRVTGHRFAVLPGSRQLTSVRSLLVTAPGKLWVATDTGVVEFQNGYRRRHLGARDGIPLPAMSIAKDRSGRLWVAGRKNVVREDEHGRFRSVLEAPNVWHLAAEGDRIAIDAGYDVYTVDADGKIEHRRRGAGFGGTNGETLVRHAVDGSIWRNKLDRLERNGRSVFESPCKINDFNFGADGAVWVGTGCSGMYELRPRHIFAISKLGGTILGSVYSLAQAPDGTLWISTLSHSVAIVSPTGAVAWLDDEKGRLGMSLSVVSINTDGETWVGSCRVVAAARCATPANWPSALGSGDAVQAIHRARDGSLWVGGLGLWRESTAGKWQNWSAQVGLVGGTTEVRVRVILEADDGTLWFGTHGAGVVRRDPQGHFRRFTLADGLASNAIRALRLHQHELWIATQDRGLCRMQAPESATPRITCIDTSHGLWSDSLHEVLFDDEGRMWLNSNNGIFAMPVATVDAVLDGRAERVYPQVYTERDGSPSREGNGGVDHAGIRLADGRFAFPTEDGVAVFDPRDLPPPQEQVRAVFERLTLPDGRSLAVQQHMTLARGIRNFTLQYTALAQRLTEPAYFRYRLLPNKAWIDVGDARQLSLSNLLPGNKTIELVALGSNAKAGPPERMTLNLPPYWYETTAFRSIAPLLLLLVVLWWFWHLRRTGLTRQRQLERSVVERTADLHSALDTIEHLAASKSRFFANVSHELRTPLALLIGPIDDYAGGRAPSKKLLGAMQRNAHRLERLIDQLLDLERLDARRFPLRPQTLDLAVLADESVTAFIPLSRHENIKLDLRVPGAPVLVRGDSEQLMRVIGNLLSNALKFCPSGGRVAVTLGHGDEQIICLRVDDSGPGIAPDWRTRIFDRFSQMGSDATRGREGAGLGLALSREVAELHGGRLYATDSSLGGAGLVFELPSPSHSPLSDYVDNSAVDIATNVDCREENGHPNVESVASPPQPVDTGDDENQTDPHVVEQGDIEPDDDKSADRPLVLLAEDNDDLRHYLIGILEKDYRVVAAVDGELALEQARTEAPDLIVTDLMMPKLDGLGLAHAIRVQDELAGVPIIFLTARAADNDRVAGLDGGADYYLTKPFDSRVLLAQIGAALRACQRLRQRYAQQAASIDAETANPPARSEFVARIDALFEAHAHDPEFGVPAMVDALHLSETALRRHFRDECQASPGERLRQHRLQRAHELLRQGTGNVSEVAYAVGYASLASFGRAYRELYGHPPTQSRSKA